ncbi:HemK2/MTQ2 family protein methyltransferase [Gordonia alkaliphila]|uniref:Methyltransferase n=1 Tax=Gordonia alkaliphila TaxID=1053547 RepID=A0ABP8Z7M5_9ACTN
MITPEVARSSSTPIEPTLVYQPQADTQLLIDALDDCSPAGLRVLDLCTGSGAVAAAAATRGAAEVVAVDLCPHAVRAAAALAPEGVRWSAVRADVGDFADANRFDLVTCNPPYVPAPDAPDECPSVVGPAHAWDAGPDGRAVLDRLCARAEELLRPGGRLLLVQSALAAPYRTRELLEARGFRTSVVRRRRVEFGPVLRARRDWLVTQGLMHAHEASETLTVLLAEHAPGLP